MKQYWIAGLCMVMGTLAAFAQTHPEHQRRGHVKQHEKLKTELSLSDQQYATIEGANKKYREQRLTLKSDSSLSREQKMLERKKYIAEREKEINAVLTPEQQTKWKGLKEERAKGKHDRKEAKHRMKKELSLTAEQASQMKKANREMHEKIKLLRADAKTTKDAQRAEMIKTRDEHNAKVKSILSEEQFQKWDDLHREGREPIKKKN